MSETKSYARWVLAGRIMDAWAAAGLVDGDDTQRQGDQDPEWQKAKVAAETAMPDDKPYWWDGSKTRPPTAAEVAAHGAHSDGPGGAE